MKFENGNFDEKDVSVAPIDFAFCARDINKKRDEADKVIKEIEKTTDELNKENEREVHMKNKFPSYKKLQLSESLFEDFEDEHVGKPSRKCKQCVKSVRKPLKKESKLDESYVLLDLADFKPWSGAVPYWDKIVDADKIDEFDALLDDLYPDGIREVDLNDWLRYEGDDVLEMLGIADEEEDDEEESDEDEED